MNETLKPLDMDNFFKDFWSDDRWAYITAVTMSLSLILAMFLSRF